MAYYNEQEDEEQDPNAPQEQPGSGTSGVLDAAGAANSPAGAASTSSGTGSTDHFVGIDQYINANKPQSQKLAQEVGASVTDQGNQARATLDQGKSSFDQAVAGNTVNFNQDLAGRVQNQAQTLSEQERAEVKRQRDAQYGGPASFQETAGYAPAQQAVQRATQASENTKTEAGQRELLKPMEQRAKHGATAGIGTFDTALLQAAPNARTELAQARQNVSDIDPKFQQLLSEALSGAAGARATTEGTAAQTQAAIGQGVQGLDVPQRYQDYLTGVQEYNAHPENSVGEDPASFFGVDPNTVNYGVKDYTNYLKQTSPASLGEFASAEDYAKYAALQDLGGQFNFQLKPEDAALAGTAGDKGKSVADKDRLLQAIAAAKGDYENKLNTQKATGVSPYFADYSLNTWLGQLPTYWKNDIRPQAEGVLDQINALREQYGLGRVLMNPVTGQPLYMPDDTISGRGSVR